MKKLLSFLTIALISSLSSNVISCDNTQENITKLTYQQAIDKFKKDNPNWEKEHPKSDPSLVHQGWLGLFADLTIINNQKEWHIYDVYYASKSEGGVTTFKVYIAYEF